MAEDFKDLLNEKAAAANGIIYSYLPEEEGYQKTIFEAMNYSVKAGGKRVRPILMAETYRLLGGDEPGRKVLEPFMAAIEMIHTYSLVHDDLPAMDNDMLRRGRPTTHAVYGEAMGVLAGDALLNYAFETAMKAFAAAESMAAEERDIYIARVIKAIGILAGKAGVYGMVGGQVVDVESEGRDDMTREKLDFIHELKTAALMESSMMIGAVLAGADDDSLAVIEEAASKVGLAFQIRDDILDIEGDTAILGKTVGKDEKSSKTTYPDFIGLDNCKAYVKELSDQAVAAVDSFEGDGEFLKGLLIYMIDRNN